MWSRLAAPSPGPGGSHGVARGHQHSGLCPHAPQPLPLPWSWQLGRLHCSRPRQCSGIKHKRSENKKERKKEKKLPSPCEQAITLRETPGRLLLCSPFVLSLRDAHFRLGSGTRRSGPERCTITQGHGPVGSGSLGWGGVARSPGNMRQVCLRGAWQQGVEVSLTTTHREKGLLKGSLYS